MTSTVPPLPDEPAAPADIAEVNAQVVPGVEAEAAAVVAAPEAAAAPVAELSPSACANQLKRRFPALFGAAPKPLKLRIQADIQQRAPGVFSKPVLSAFLRRHTGGTAYLIALTRNTQRFDLDGAPAGELSDEHRKLAAEELARRRAVHEGRRELEEQQRYNRSVLLRDFQTTTLTTANFCALKGVAVDELDGLLAIARAEADERARSSPPPHQRDARERPDPRGHADRRPDRPRPPRERR